ADPPPPGAVRGPSAPPPPPPLPAVLAAHAPAPQRHLVTLDAQSARLPKLGERLLQRLAGDLDHPMAGATDEVMMMPSRRAESVAPDAPLLTHWRHHRPTILYLANHAQRDEQRQGT